MTKIAVFVSGRGSNFQAIIEAIGEGRLAAEVVLVIGDKPEIGAFDIAKKNGIHYTYFNKNDFESEENYDSAILAALEKYQVQLIALAGYMKKIGQTVIRGYKNRILNIHPALLPSFGGAGMFGVRVHKAVLGYGSKVSGVTVHLVDDEYDTGVPILQRCVPVLEDDTPETLAARVLAEEHKIFPEALQLFCENKIEVNGRKLIVRKAG